MPVRYKSYHRSTNYPNTQVIYPGIHSNYHSITHLDSSTPICVAHEDAIYGPIENSILLSLVTKTTWWKTSCVCQDLASSDLFFFVAPLFPRGVQLLYAGPLLRWHCGNITCEEAWIVDTRLGSSYKSSHASGKCLNICSRMGAGAGVLVARMEDSVQDATTKGIFSGVCRRPLDRSAAC